MKIRYGVLDDRCPTLAIIWYLKARGWRRTEGEVVHTTAEIAQFDHREATRFKPYFQVLTCLETCMALMSHVPSREAMVFYKALLQGLKVEPGQSAKDYQLVINAERKQKGKVTKLLLLEDLPGQPDPDGIVVHRPLGFEEDPAPKRGARAPGPSRSHGTCTPGSSTDGPGGVIVVAPPGGGGGGGGHGSGGDGSGGPPGTGGDGPGGAAPDPDGIVGGVPQPGPGRAEPVAKHQEIEGLDGAKLRYQPYVTKQGASYPNFTVFCNRPGHPIGCKLTRGMTPSNTRQHGSIGPLCILFAWLRHGEGTDDKPHNLCTIPKELVKEMAEQHADDFRGMLASFNITP